jgi:hypothetical protein
VVILLPLPSAERACTVFKPGRPGIHSAVTGVAAVTVCSQVLTRLLGSSRRNWYGWMPADGGSVGRRRLACHQPGASSLGSL